MDPHLVPSRWTAVASAGGKTDKVDARALAQLLGSSWSPSLDHPAGDR